MLVCYSDVQTQKMGTKLSLTLTSTPLVPYIWIVQDLVYKRLDHIYSTNGAEVNVTYKVTKGLCSMVSAQQQEGTVYVSPCYNADISK